MNGLTRGDRRCELVLGLFPLPLVLLFFIPLPFVDDFNAGGLKEGTLLDEVLILFLPLLDSSAEGAGENVGCSSSSPLNEGNCFSNFFFRLPLPLESKMIGSVGEKEIFCELLSASLPRSLFLSHALKSPGRDPDPINPTESCTFLLIDIFSLIIVFGISVSLLIFG